MYIAASWSSRAPCRNKLPANAAAARAAGSQPAHDGAGATSSFGPSRIKAGTILEIDDPRAGAWVRSPVAMGAAFLGSSTRRPDQKPMDAAHDESQRSVGYVV